jgi:hypothetical protein
MPTPKIASAGKARVKRMKDLFFTVFQNSCLRIMKLYSSPLSHQQDEYPVPRRR